MGRESERAASERGKNIFVRDDDDDDDDCLFLFARGVLCMIYDLIKQFSPRTRNKPRPTTLLIHRPEHRKGSERRSKKSSIRTSIREV